MHLDIEKDRRVIPSLEANDLAVNGLALVERSHASSLDLGASLAKNVISVAIIGSAINQHHVPGAGDGGGLF
jgi:hypothetical protein